MPELPEVDFVACTLGSLITGRTIKKAALIRQRLSPETTPTKFDRGIRGSSVTRIHRRGKHILIELSKGNTLIVHLRMSGRFSLLNAEDTDPKFAHAVFDFVDGQRLVFDDQRHFGMMKLTVTDSLYNAKELAKLAPEPLGDEFSIAYFQQALSSSQRSIKEFLLDQTKVCGLGNIYAAEAMFLANIHPEKKAFRITKSKAVLLHEAIRQVLLIAIAHSAGHSGDLKDLERGYFSPAGKEWLVYGREAEPCRNCGNPIVRLKQGGRSTFYCRYCQRK